MDTDASGHAREQSEVELAPLTEQRRSAGLTPLSLLVTIFLAYLLFKIQVVLILLIGGILLATALAGPVEWLRRRWGLGRGLAILLAYVLILVTLGLLVWLLVPPVAREGARFVRDAPVLLETWRGRLVASENAAIRSAAARLFAVLDTAGGAGFPTGLALGVAQGIGGVFITTFTIFLIAFYWIAEKALIKRAAVSVVSPAHRRRALRIWNEVEVKLGAWIRGQLLLMAVVGALATLAYGLMGLPFWLILGVIAGLTEAVPNVGPIIGAVPAVLMALTVDWRLALGVVAFVVVLQLLENAVLVPRIMRGAVGLSPLTTVLAILAGGEVRGVVGALLAIPVAGAIQVILSDLLREKREREASDREQARRSWRQFLARRRATAPSPD